MHSRVATVSSLLELSSVAFSSSAAAMPGSDVDRARFRSVFACRVKYCLPITMKRTHQLQTRSGAGNIPFGAKMWKVQFAPHRDGRCRSAPPNGGPDLPISYLRYTQVPQRDRRSLLAAVSSDRPLAMA